MVHKGRLKLTSKTASVTESGVHLIDCKSLDSTAKYDVRLQLDTRKMEIKSENSLLSASAINCPSSETTINEKNRDKYFVP